jgi:hypothetical protein
MRRRVRVAGLATAAMLAACAAAGAASSDSRVIQASATFQRLGPYWISDDPTYAGALEALGPSSSCHLVDYTPSTVAAAWRPLGVTMSLVTFGGMPAGKTGCTAPGRIQVSTVRVTGRRWTTSVGLHVGDPVTRLTQLYPRAIATKGVPGWYRAGYWLVTRRGVCLGVCGERFVTAPVLVAETAGGRVSAIVFVVGAQGE